jgi:thermitase
MPPVNTDELSIPSTDEKSLGNVLDLSRCHSNSGRDAPPGEDALMASRTFTTTFDRIASHGEGSVMKRTQKARRFRLACESLETRSLLTGSVQSAVAVANPNPNPSTSIFVEFTTTDSLSSQKAALRSVHASVITTYPSGDELVGIGSETSTAAAIKKLEATPGVVFASPDSIIHESAVAGLPNDPDFSQQWGLDNPDGVDIDAVPAWGVTLGSTSTIVAVIDTGIDLDNPDFAGKIWTNPVNDAAEGYPNDVHGWNFIDNTSDVQDNNGHGTHVSAIIAAIGNNNYGVAGVDPSAQIMPLKFLDSNGNGTTDDAVSAIYFAVEHGAQVINASWGGVAASAPLQAAIAYANAHNVVFVTAAGNDGTDNDTVPSYPASYQEPNELSVAAVDQNGNLASFSNYGASTVNLGAPGVNIVSDVPTSIEASGLQTLSGTSMAAAYVSGVAALVSGLNPSFTAAEIVARIDSTTKPLPSLSGNTISGGMVDAYNAVTDTVTSEATTTAPASGIPTFTPGQATQVEVHAAILASDEFFNNNGGTAVGFINGLYESLLDRAPDPAGLQLWVATYDSGTVTRYQIALAIASSAEARLVEVANWYQQELGRTQSVAQLETDPGVILWATLLDQGTGDNTVLAQIMASTEYLADHGGTPVSEVQGFYANLTDRTADPAGESYWSGLLYQGFAPYTVLRMFQASAEFEETLVADWYSSDLGRTESIAQLKEDSDVQTFASALGNF